MAWVCCLYYISIFKKNPLPILGGNSPGIFLYLIVFLDFLRHGSLLFQLLCCPPVHFSVFNPLHLIYYVFSLLLYILHFFVIN